MQQHRPGFAIGPVQVLEHEQEWRFDCSRMKQMNGGFKQSNPLVRSAESFDSGNIRSGRERGHQARQWPNHIIASMVEECRLLASPLGKGVGKQAIGQRLGSLVGAPPRDTETALPRSFDQCLDQTALSYSSLT